MGGGLAACALPLDAFAAVGKRSFELVRNGDVIGSHTLSPTERGGDLIMDIAIEIRVRVLGITAYRYEHQNRETWTGGRLKAIDAKTNDDGDEEFCRVSQSGDGYDIAGTAFNGPVSGPLAPTSYWNYNNFQTPRWISTQSGKILDMTFRNTTSAAGEVWNVSGPDNFATELAYDRLKEWRGCRFDARGTDIVYRETAPGAQLLALL